MSTSENKAVFLSYASQDAEAAKRICETLRQAGVEVWFDQSELVGGDAWDAKIRGQIASCALFVPIISANTQARREGYFRIEWKLAAQRTHAMADGTPFLLPVVIDETRDGEALVPAEFRAVQWTRLASVEASHTFCERVRKLLGREEGARAREPEGAEETVWKARATPPAAEKAIAVLAFANMSRDQDNEYFADGITEELLNVLAKVPGLRVTARTSAFYFKGKNVPVPEIARQLGVSHVVEGSVRKAGDRVRITAQLINASDGFHLWSDAFDREVKDIFAVQDEIAALIARNLQIKLGDTRRAARTVNPEAYRLCLEGRKLGIVFSEEGFAQAEALFKRALTIDPSFARSQTDLALLGLYRASLRSVAAKYFPADVDAAEHHAREALRMDSGVGEPHITLAYVALLRGQQPEAERELQQAIEICPESEHRFMVQAFILMGSGRPDRAALEMQKARRRDPISWLPADLLGLSLTLAGRPAEALEPFERAEHLGGPPVVYANHALALAKLGRRDEAIARARLAVDAAQHAGWEEGFLAQTRGFAARVLAESGLTDEAAALVQRLQSGPVALRCHAGMGLIALGETDAGFTLLTEFPRHVFGYVMHFLHGRESLRNDSRTTGLLTKVGATEAFETMGRVLRGEPMPP